MGKEKACFWYFLLIWKDLSLLPTYPKNGIKTNVVHL